MDFRARARARIEIIHRNQARRRATGANQRPTRVVLNHGTSPQRIVVEMITRVLQNGTGSLDRSMLADVHRVLTTTTTIPERLTLPVMRVEGELPDCAICLCSMEVGEEMIALPCQLIVNHSFHSECIKPWISKNRTCPVCRGNF